MMYRKPLFRAFPLLVLVVVMVLSGCGPLIEPVTTVGKPPTPVVSFSSEGVDNPDVYVDPASFQAALLQALVAQDTARLRLWMTEPFLTGGWRADLSDTPTADALKELYSDQLGANAKLALVKNADLKALMGGEDPLSLPRGEAGVEEAILVTGWGAGGRDEAVLFISRMPDNSLKWHGWMRITGGFSGAGRGGNQLYTSDAFGFSLFLPKEFEVSAPVGNEVLFLGPGAGHPTDNRVGVFIFVEPADGRTAEQVATQKAEQAKKDMGAAYTGGGITVMGIDGEAAYSVGGLPGQDINRQVFITHGGQLYWMMFVPDSPQASAYPQMEDAYAMIVNTFHFTR